MVKLSCFSTLLGKKKNKKQKEQEDAQRRQRTLQVKVERATDCSKKSIIKGASFHIPVPFEIDGSPTFKVKVLREEVSPTSDAAYEGEYEDEHQHKHKHIEHEHEQDNLSMKRDFSDIDLQTRGEDPCILLERPDMSDVTASAEPNNKSERDEADMLENGHLSDPGIAKARAWGSPKLKRSCSNLERRVSLKRISSKQLTQSNSFDDLENAAENIPHQGFQDSPLSVISSRSADKIMLKKRSSRQVLPSRSRRLWWKLFLWSHRNLHRAAATTSKLPLVVKLNKQADGYSSDTLETSLSNAGKKKGPSSGNQKLGSPSSFYGELRSKNWSNLHRNQWLAFSSESSSPLSRVDEWINTLETESVLSPHDEDCEEQSWEIEPVISNPPSPGKDAQSVRPTNAASPEEVVQANKVVVSLNSYSTVAHIAGMGLKVIPNISPYLSLRSINLSGNFIVHIAPGSLPKSLHTLDLSKNKISTIEGLRELTRLRILDLSYNRIFRIGHGLSKCTLIKELYVAGNNISDVESLHRLPKLAVLDLSFNKITNAKALGQLVANYHSLMALNLLGNPIQRNIGDEQLKKTVSSLLPQLAFLNKQPIKPHRAREVPTDSVIKAALGNGGLNSRRKPAKRSNGVTASAKGKSSEVRSHQRQRGSSQRSPTTRREVIFQTAPSYGGHIDNTLIR